MGVCKQPISGLYKLKTVFYLKGFIMQDGGGAFEEAVDVATPLGEERTSTKIFHVRFQGGPDVRQYVLVGMFDAALHSCGDAAGMLANNIQSLEYALP